MLPSRDLRRQRVRGTQASVSLTRVVEIAARAFDRSALPVAVIVRNHISGRSSPSKADHACTFSAYRLLCEALFHSCSRDRI